MTPPFSEASALPGSFPEGHFSSLASLSPRDTAVRFFGLMAARLDQVGVREAPLVLPFWPYLPGSIRRPLERTALTLGADLRRFNSGGTRLIPATTLPGGPGTPSLPTIAPAGAMELVLPGGPPPPPFGAGAFRPGVALLVGDRSNVARLGQLKHRLPFVTFAGSGVGPWLNRQLDSALVGEDELYWINAYDATGAATDPAVIAELRPRIVVALGRLAERWCADTSVPFVALLSPYEWRKAERAPYSLGRILREGA